MAHARDMAEPDATSSDVPDVLAPDLRIVFVGMLMDMPYAFDRRQNQPVKHGIRRLQYADDGIGKIGMLVVAVDQPMRADHLVA